MEAVLWGRDHIDLGQIGVAAAGDRAALALSRGGRPKRYSHTDLNEDVVAAVVGRQATLLVCADGHNGETASHVAVRTVLDALGPEPPPTPTDEDWLDLFTAANDAVVAATNRPDSVHPSSRTVLLVAIESHRLLTWAAMGDAALVVVAPGRRGRQLNRERMRFVGYPISDKGLAGVVQRGTRTLDEDEWVVLVTDGLSEFIGPARVADVLPPLLGPTPEAAARRIVETAFEAGAGDNVGCAVLAPG